MRLRVAAFIALTVAAVIAAALARDHETFVGVLGLVYFASLLGLAVTVR